MDIDELIEWLEEKQKVCMSRRNETDDKISKEVLFYKMKAFGEVKVKLKELQQHSV